MSNQVIEAIIEELHELADIPKDFTIPKVEVIDQSNNRPNYYYVSKNKSITALSLEGLELNSLPASISLLDNLEVLDLGYNNIKVLPDWITVLPLQKLYLHYNCVSQLPNEMEDMEDLQVLDLAGNDLTELPNLINLNDLDFLYLHKNRIKVLPQIPLYVKYLNLGENHLTEVTIPRLNEVLELKFDNNQISQFSLPSKGLPQLRELHLRNNALPVIPKGVTESKNLRVLVLRENYLETLPDTLGKLRNLTTLDARANLITYLPSFSWNLEQTKIDLRWNKLESIPMWVLKHNYSYL